MPSKPALRQGDVPCLKTSKKFTFSVFSNMTDLSFSFHLLNLAHYGMLESHQDFFFSLEDNLKVFKDKSSNYLTVSLVGGQLNTSGILLNSIKDFVETTHRSTPVSNFTSSQLHSKNTPLRYLCEVYFPLSPLILFLQTLSNVDLVLSLFFSSYVLSLRCLGLLMN